MTTSSLLSTITCIYSLCTFLISTVRASVALFLPTKDGISFLGGRQNLSNVCRPQTIAEISTILRDHPIDRVYIVGGAAYYNPRPVSPSVHIMMDAFREWPEYTVRGTDIDIRANIRMSAAVSMVHTLLPGRALLATSDWLGESVGGAISTHQHGTTQSAWAIDDILCIGVVLADTGEYVETSRGTPLFGKVAMGCGRAGVVVWARFRTHTSTLCDYLYQDSTDIHADLEALADTDAPIRSINYTVHRTLQIVRRVAISRTSANRHHQDTTDRTLDDAQHVLSDGLRLVAPWEQWLDLVAFHVRLVERLVNHVTNDYMIPLAIPMELRSQRNTRHFVHSSRDHWIRMYGSQHLHYTVFLPASVGVRVLSDLFGEWIASGQFPHLYVRYVQRSTTVSPNLPFGGDPCYSVTITHPLGIHRCFERSLSMIREGCRDHGIESVWHNGKQPLSKET